MHIINVFLRDSVSHRICQSSLKYRFYLFCLVSWLQQHKVSCSKTTDILACVPSLPLISLLLIYLSLTFSSAHCTVFFLYLGMMLDLSNTFMSFLLFYPPPSTNSSIEPIYIQSSLSLSCSWYLYCLASDLSTQYTLPTRLCTSLQVSVSSVIKCMKCTP